MNISSLSDPQTLLTQVTSKIPITIFNNQILSVHRNTLFFLQIPSLSLEKSIDFDNEITAITTSQTTIYIAFDLKINQNSGLITQFDAEMVKLHSISLQTPPHLLAADGQFLAACHGNSAKLYNNFKQIQQFQNVSKAVSVEINQDQAVIIYSEKTIQLSATDINEVSEHVPCAGIFYENSLLTSGRDNSLAIQQNQVISRNIFLNTKFYSMKQHGTKLICINDDGQLQIVDLSQIQFNKELVFSAIYPIFSNGKRISNCIQIEILQNYLFVIDYELTIFIIDLSTSILIENEFFTKTLSASSSQFGEILAIAKFNDKFVFSGSSSSFYIFDNQKSQNFCIAVSGHVEVVTHIQTFDLDDEKIVMSASADQIIFWREKEVTFENQEIGQFLQIQPNFEQTIQKQLVPFLEISLQTSQQVTALAFTHTKTRAILAYSCDKQIYTLELQKYLFLDNSGKFTPAFEKVTAHMDFINDIHFISTELLVSGSADKALSLWNVGHVTKTQKQEVISIFDIFTGKVNKKRSISIDSDQSNIQLIHSIPNLSKRTIWGISQFGKYLVVACGDKRVRIVQFASSELKVVKTIENFNFPVVRAQFLNEKQVLCLQNSGIISVHNIGTGEVDFVLSTQEFAQDILVTKSLKKSIKLNEEIEEERTDFGTFSFYWDSDAVLIGTSNGKILEMYNNTEEKNILRENEKVQEILNAQLFNNALNEDKYAAAVQLAIRQKDDKLLLEAITQCLVKNVQDVDFSEFKLTEFWQLLVTSVRWLRMAKKAQQGIFLLDNMTKYCRLKALKDAYGQNCEGLLNDGIRLLEKHRERIAVQRGQVRMIGVYEM
ncbi:WD40 repeat protein [Spironucleus salmonicida]|uniref:WD domain, G-beta repeat-containing protein n=1 Tax=Spironucleus salmonicida TaxID=348837 RepID=V6LLA4_9EUKA|nr:WD40 repeat protein [Spironucleus salmonicida]|eukprot:EST44516.1 WD domain, G-beta repeat-containing protein [Spironucleus salmonicida]